jgi:hypothetical protein
MNFFFTLIICFLVVPFAGNAFTAYSNITPATVTPAKTTVKKLTYKQNKALLETALGRKLKLREKMALRIQSVMPDYKSRYDDRANSNAVLGFIFALCGLIVLWPLLIPGLILSSNALRSEKINPGSLSRGNKDLAKAGKIISLIGLIIIALAIIILAIVIASVGFGGL